MDGLLAKLAECTPFCWDIPLSLEYYTTEIRVADFVRAASVNLTATAGPTLIVMGESVEPVAEAAPAPKKRCRHQSPRRMTNERGGEVDARRGRDCPSKKGLVVGSPTAPVAPTPTLEEGGPIFGDDDYNALPIDVSEAEQIKEEDLSLAFKALMGTALQEQPALAANLLP